MLDNEVEISHFFLSCNTIVFISETAFASRIRPYVSHETMYLCVFYYLVARFASRRELSKESRSVWAGVTWVTLCSIPLTALVSLLYNFRHSIVDCIVDDVSNDGESCRLGQDRKRCQSLAIAARRQTAQEGCATFVLGPFMGTLYAVMVFLLRFVPCFIGGIYFAFNFSENRLHMPGTTSLSLPMNGEYKDPPLPLPSTFFYVGWSLLLWGAFTLEFAAGRHMELSTYTTMVFFEALAMLQLYRAQARLSEVEERSLQRLQFMGSMVLVVFAYMDVLRNAVGLISTCVGIVDYKAITECLPGDIACLDTRNVLTSVYFRQHSCPQLRANSIKYANFYLSQGLRLFFLCLIYPVTMVYRHIQQDRIGDGRMSGTAYIKKQIDNTPAEKLREMFVVAAEMDLQHGLPKE